MSFRIHDRGPCYCLHVTTATRARLRASGPGLNGGTHNPSVVSGSYRNWASIDKFPCDMKLTFLSTAELCCCDGNVTIREKKTHLREIVNVAGKIAV